METEEVILKRERPGRPRRCEAPPTKTVYKVKVQVGPLNEEAYAQVKLKASCFLLIANRGHGRVSGGEGAPGAEGINPSKLPSAQSSL